MAEQKSYNLRTLRGDESYDDNMFQQDMKESGINIPDDLLYTPELNQYVAAKMRDKNITEMQTTVNPETGVNFTEEEAKSFAEETYNNVIEKSKAFSK